MKKLLLTILLNVLLLLPVVGWGGVHSFIRYGKWWSGEALGLQIRASEANDTEYAYLYDETNKFLRILDEADEVSGVGNLDDLVAWASQNDLAYLTRVELDNILNFVDNNLDFAKRIASSTKEIQSASTLTELVRKLNLPISPTPGSLTPYQARVWYNWRKSQIFDLIDKSQTLENQAKQAVNLRNEIRITTRQAMEDNDIANFLDAKEVNMTWEEALNKYGSDYNEIIQASMRGRGSLNELFKIPDAK
jgi:hypothetical protein